MSLVLLLATIAGLVGLVRFGELEDRAAVVLIAVYLVINPYAQHIRIETWRLGTASAELFLFVGFWQLAERRRRWWMTAAAGFQFISVLSFIVPWLAPGYLVWTAVTFRWAAWVLITATLFVGAWEAWADRKYRLEEAINGSVQGTGNP